MKTTNQVLESKFTKAICNEFKKLGAKIITIAGGRFQEPGLPDRLVIWRGLHIWLEFKGEKTQVQQHQLNQMAELSARKANVFIIRAPNKIYDWKNEFIDTFVNGHDLLFLLLHLSQSGAINQNANNGP